jgi:hypothetical protein
VTDNHPIATYQQRRAAFEAERLAVQRRWNLIANIRLAGFAVLALVVWSALRAPALWKWGLAFVVLGAVVGLVIHHGQLRRQRDRLASLVQVNDLALARYALDWSNLSASGPQDLPRTHPYAWDLDIVGPSSLLKRISTPTLQGGWDTLASWLLAPSSPDTIAERQPAVAELAAHLDLRQQVEVAGRQADGATPDPEPFLAWSREESWLLDRPWLWMLAIVSPVALVVSALLFFSGLVRWPLWLVPVTINVIVFQLVGKHVSSEVARATPLHGAIAGYAEIFRRIGEAPASSGLLQGIGATLGTGPQGATSRMAAFARISSFVIPRASIIWAPVQMALLWDVHVLHGLERWRQRSGSQVHDWFTAAGEWEALAAVSVLVHDNPGWTFPVVTGESRALTATALTHPLIHPSVAVANDVTVGPQGTFLFVTGSNMSGKSTLLRAVGLNAVLAMAGGPVAASTLAMPPLSVASCMRVEDSVAQGVSFFMAELQRLKSVVDRAAEATPDRPLLYLLDEILQGTNTAERQIASRRVLAQLARRPAIGAVSSHDLTLIEGSGLEAVAVPVHFAETFTRDATGPNMTFDYRLQPGLATSTNALALMELLGFDVTDD